MNEYSTRQAAELSGKGYSTVTKYCLLGTIGRIVGSRYILTDKDIEWLKKLPKHSPHTEDAKERIKAGNRAFRQTLKGKKVMQEAWEKRRFSKIKKRIKGEKG